VAAGLDAATTMVTEAMDGGRTDCVVVLVTDGRATGGDHADPLAAAHAAMARLHHTGARVVVLDSEVDAIRLGLAGELAEAVGAEYLTLGEARDADLERLVRSL
jgi:magnesium chelatase subunit D